MKIKKERKDSEKVINVHFIQFSVINITHASGNIEVLGLGLYIIANNRADKISYHISMQPQ